MSDNSGDADISNISEDEFDSESVDSDATENIINNKVESILTTLENTLRIIDDIGEKRLEKHIEKATINQFGSVNYLKTSSFGLNKFKIKSEFKEKLESIGITVGDRYTFSEYCSFLTKYIVENDLSDEMGIIDPDEFLCDLLKIEDVPCTFIKLMGCAKNVFY